MSASLNVGRSKAGDGGRQIRDPLNQSCEWSVPGNRTLSSIFHRLLEDVGFVHVACSNWIHLRCAKGIVEDTATRDGIRGVSYPNLCTWSAVTFVCSPFCRKFVELASW